MTVAHPEPVLTAATSGLYGPFPLSERGRGCLDELIAETAKPGDRMNLHAHSAAALALIRDSEIVKHVAEIFGNHYKLWRTNIFQRRLGEPHAGVGWHHDKHFQHGEAEIDYQEAGDHISILIACNAMDSGSGLLHYIPGSHKGFLIDYTRDQRPYFLRPTAEHFLSLPDSLISNSVQLEIPAAHFCLFHSALLHSTAPSSGERARISMIGRLVRSNCQVPLECAAAEQIVPYC